MHRECERHTPHDAATSEKVKRKNAAAEGGYPLVNTGLPDAWTELIPDSKIHRIRQSTFFEVAFMGLQEGENE